MTNEALSAFGHLLAIVSDALREVEVLQRRGPSRYRRYAALLTSRLIAAIVMVVQQQALAVRVERGASGGWYAKLMLRPPEAWAAP